MSFAVCFALYSLYGAFRTGQVVEAGRKFSNAADAICTFLLGVLFLPVIDFCGWWGGSS